MSAHAADRRHPSVDEFLEKALRDLDAIRWAQDRLMPDCVDDVNARRLMEHYGSLRRRATHHGFMEMAEIAMSGESVFQAVSARSLSLNEEEIEFLRNVVMALWDLLKTIEERTLSRISMELLGDGFDHLLNRLDAA